MTVKNTNKSADLQLIYIIHLKIVLDKLIPYLC